MNQKILLQKVNGELPPEDFAILKENVTQQKAEAEAQLLALDAETSTMQGLFEQTQQRIVDLVGAWRTGDTQQRRELASSLYPEGLVYSTETQYFEPRNTLLMNSVERCGLILRPRLAWCREQDLNLHAFWALDPKSPWPIS